MPSLFVINFSERGEVVEHTFWIQALDGFDYVYAAPWERASALF
jgi:hypothetical protein